MFSLPFPIFLAQTNETRAKTGYDRHLFVGEKDSLFDVMPVRDPTRRAFAVERAVDFVAPVSAKGSFPPAFVKFAVSADELVGFVLLFGHRIKICGEFVRFYYERSLFASQRCLC